MRTSGVKRGLSQEGNVAERDPLATVGYPLLANTQKNLKMVVNPDRCEWLKNNKSPESTPKNAKKLQLTENQKNT